jgi:hypothetical protein
MTAQRPHGDAYGFGKRSGEVMQLAWVVRDLDTAIRHQVDVLGIGPWFVFEHFKLENLQYRGEPSNLDISLALAFSGDMCVELIQQHDDGASVYRDLLGRQGTGFHHWGVASADYEGDIARYGEKDMPLIVDGRVSVGARAGYVDARAALQGYIEIIEVTPDVDGLFTMIRDAATSWDGRMPIRAIS